MTTWDAVTRTESLRLPRLPPVRAVAALDVPVSRAIGPIILQMFARLVRLVSVLSLLLCIACAAMWIRSYFTLDLLVYGGSATDGHLHTGLVTSGLGNLQLELRRAAIAAGRDAEYDADFYEWNPSWPRGWTLRAREGFPLGAQDWFQGLKNFDWQSHQHKGLSAVIGTSQWYVAFPWWTLVLLFGALPLTRMLLHRRDRRRRRRGVCRNCGYDLRASPGRCPECGLEPEDAFDGSGIVTSA